MQVLPQLNLNKHPAAVKNGSLVDANNMIISNDNFILQNEPLIKKANVSKLINALLNGKSFTITYAIPCNKEIIIFVDAGVQNKLTLIRYNEDKDKAVICCDIEYSGGIILGTFTYNFNNLIIAFTEYSENNDIKVPLKTINLGEFDKELNDIDKDQLTNIAFHPICPEVIIPNISNSYINDLAYKGWYFIFIRYKIGNNTYTQWFNTNSSIFVDDYNNQETFKYSIPKDYNIIEDDNLGSGHTDYKTFTADEQMSDNKDVCGISFKSSINNIDNRYRYYQLGYVCVSKSYTKSYSTNDLNVGITELTFNSGNVHEYNVTDLIATYYNYYNVKSLTNFSNRLFIGNYKESSIIDVKTLKDITLTFNFTTIDSKIIDVNNTGGEFNSDEPSCKVNLNSVQYISFANFNGFDNTDNPEGYYLNLTQFVGYRKSTNKYELYSINKPCSLWQYEEGSDGYHIYLVNPNQVYIYPFKTRGNLKGVIQCRTLTQGNNGMVSNIHIANQYTTRDRLIGPMICKIGDDESYEDDPIYIICGGEDFQDLFEVEELEQNTTNRILRYTTNSIYPDSYYNFFIHFVDKYGAVTNGYNFKYFNLVTDADTFNNMTDNLIIKSTKLDDITKYLIANCKLDKIPNNYIGYFISYEKFESTYKYNGIVIDDGNYKFYNDKLNYDDSIDFGFDKVDIYTIDNIIDDDLNKKFITNNTTFSNTISIITKTLLVADSYNNTLKSTCIMFNGSTNSNETKVSGFGDKRYTAYYAKLYTSKGYNTYYNNANKILIPCSDIKYIANDNLIVNTKNAFISLCHAKFYNNRIYNDALKVFQVEGDSLYSSRPLYNYKWNYFIDVPMESLQYNNKPIVVFAPIKGLNTDKENEKAFVVNNIVEAKNSIDLYQQKQFSYDNAYPKSLTWYDEDVITTNDFPKTIRRSATLQDESHEISWRKFGIEDYKNITENKGNIIKLISIGYLFLVHTQHSLFQFDASDSIKANNGDIQLASIDIWDIKYKEILTSKLGFAGIKHEWNGIIGGFGYIFYDSDSKRFFRYDDKLDYIDTNINNYFDKHDYDISFVEDSKRNRLLIKCDNDIISYNYNLNTFVSFHDIIYNNAYNTKNNIYLFNCYDLNEADKRIKDGENIIIYPVANYDNQIDKYNNNASVTIFLNTNYEIIKYLEYIIYKVVEVVDIDYTTSPVEGLNMYYAGDRLIIKSNLCNTGEIDISRQDPANEVNNVMEYTKPAWRLGNWHFNAIRNRITDYLNGQITHDGSSRVYGNWFAITFKFNTNKQIEIESINPQFTNGELV